MTTNIFKSSTIQIEKQRFQDKNQNDAQIDYGRDRI